MGWENGEDLDEREDIPEEHERDLRKDLEIPDVYWKDDIAKIENPVLQDKAIEKAKRLKAEEKEIDRQLEAGEIDEITHGGKKLCDLGPKEHSASVEAQLASVGLTWDKLGDLAEDHALLERGDIGTLDKKERNKELIEKVGVEKSQEILDRMEEEGRLTKEEYESAARLIRVVKESDE